jgi:NAD(P)-dependent dehydrogenase (short-subunit alcohol dehydrogenase family)
MERRVAVVTGASTGIGAASVPALIAGGFHVFGSVRRAADADRMRAANPEHFTPVLFDVNEQAGVEAGAAMVAAALGARRLAVLINNAGIAVPGPLLHLSSDDLRAQMETNLIAVHTVTRAFAPLLGTDPGRTGPPGRILNISSVSGKFAYPFVGAYVASKHAREGYSAALRRELLLFGIDVVVIGPGAVRTPIWGKTTFARFADTPYAGALARFAAEVEHLVERSIPVAAAADRIARIAVVDQPRVRYALVRNAWLHWHLPRLLPARWMDRVLGKRFGLG